VNVIEIVQLDKPCFATATLAADRFKKVIREGKMLRAPVVDAVVFGRERLSQPHCASYLICATSEILSSALGLQSRANFPDKRSATAGDVL